MARRTLTDQSDAEFEAIDAEFSDTSKIVADQDAEEEDIAQEFGSASDDRPMHFVVKKRIPDSKLLSHCFVGKHSDLPVLPRIQQEHGGGIYEIWLFRSGRLYRKFTLAVEEPRTQQTAKPVSDPALTEMVRQQGELLKRLTETPKPLFPPMSGADLPAIITAGAAAITALKGMFTPAPQNSLSDMLGLLATAKEIMGEGRSNDEEGGVFGLLKSVATNPAIAEAIAGISRAAPQAAPAPAQIGYSPVTIPPQQFPVQAQINPNPPPPLSEQEQQIVMLQKEMRRLTTRAEKNSDPQLWADVLLDTYDEKFLSLLGQPGAIEFLLQVYPPATSHKPWFEALIREVIAGLADHAESAINPDIKVNFDQGNALVSESSPADADAAFDP